MNATGRNLAFLFLGGLLATAATLTFPAPATAQYITTGIYSPGGGPPDPVFQFSVPGPPGAPVTVDFSACHNLWLSAAQPMPPGFPALLVGCAPHAVTTIVGPGGTAFFRIIASSANPGGGTLPASMGPCATITVAGFLVGVRSVATVDQDNAVGMGVADLSAVIGDVIYSQTHLPQFFARSDFENDSDSDAADIAKWIDFFINKVIPAGTNGPSCGDAGFVCCGFLV